MVAPDRSSKFVDECGKLCRTNSDGFDARSGFKGGIGWDAHCLEALCQRTYTAATFGFGRGDSNAREIAPLR